MIDARSWHYAVAPQGALPDPAQFQTIQPRTIGFTASRSF